MTARATVLSFGTGLSILAAATAGVLSYRGTGTGAVAGAALGILLGAGGTALEVLLLHRALRRPRGDALRIVLGGFVLRLAILVGGSFGLAALRIADAASFALCFLGAFLAALPILGSLHGGGPAVDNGGARG